MNKEIDLVEEGLWEENLNYNRNSLKKAIKFGIAKVIVLLVLGIFIIIKRDKYMSSSYVNPVALGILIIIIAIGYSIFLWKRKNEIE